MMYIKYSFNDKDIVANKCNNFDLSSTIPPHINTKRLIKRKKYNCYTCKQTKEKNIRFPMVLHHHIEEDSFIDEFFGVHFVKCFERKKGI